MNVSATRAAPGTLSGKGHVPFYQVVRFALRELRAGVGGFGIFISCIALGVAVITGVGALTDALLNGFAREGRILLGGDVALRRVHQRADEHERAAMAKLGQVSETATMRSMARLTSGEDQALVEIKAVDEVYPLLGNFELAGNRDFRMAVRETAGAVVAQSLLDRLGLQVDEFIKIGTKILPITGVIENEPDKVSARLAFGPRIVVSHETLAATGLVQPGTLINWRYAIAAPDGDSRPEVVVNRLRAATKTALGETGFIVRDRHNPSPSIKRVLDRLRQFLTLLGLAALLIGGVGVANSVQTFVDRRRKVIATYKSVGATSSTVLGIYLTQIMIISAIGTVVGLVIGSAVPGLLSFSYADALPIALGSAFSWSNIATGLLYGFLVALLFVLWPLGQAERIRPAALFRDEVANGGGLPSIRILILIGVAGSLLIVFTAISSGAPRLATGFLAGALAILFLFWTIGVGVTWVARRASRPRRPELALAMIGLAAPGGLTRSVVLSLGAGLSLLVGVALVDASLIDELKGRMPENSPNYFAVDIPKQDLVKFETEVRNVVSDAVIETAPMLRGRIVRLNDIAAEEAKVEPQAQWVLNGDRGLTYADRLPKGSNLVAGDWWDEGYEGEPLVSFVDDLAEEMGLELGDTVTVNILGRNITARIANLRRIEWESLAINFIMVFSPNTLAAAPHNVLATIQLPRSTSAISEASIARAIGKTMPTISLIRVRDAIEAFAEVFGQVMIAVRVAASITLLAGALVLAGAMATAQRRRILQSVILKCIGATRRKLLLSHFVEYGLLALLTAAVSLVIGSIAAWLVVTYILEGQFVFSWAAVAGSLIVSVILILLFGAFGTWRVLAAKPVPVLRGL
ncbi:MAG: ABC transporter permease [Hyphomicrobiaceae bacterium]